MRKVKPYIFNGVECSDLNTLAEEYIKDFPNAMEDIFKNAKQLIKFVKRCRRDKEFTLEIAKILTGTKYKNNALTFIIFAFTGSGRIVINGVEMTFRGFLEEFKVNTSKEDNALYAFMEDQGISKTFAIVEHDEDLKKNAAYVEKSYDSDFTRKYLESYYDFTAPESIENRITNVVITDEECFRKATNLAMDERFQLAIAHNIGFKEASLMHKEVNPLFEAVKIVKATNECQDEKLLKLIMDTFYWWLIDNLDKYQPKSKDAKHLFESLDDLKSKIKKDRELIKKKKIYSLSVDQLADISKELYLYYLDFVTLFRNDQIIVRKKFNTYDYVFDKPYCNTFITASYMEGKVITIQNQKEDDSERGINILTGEEIDKDLIADSDLPEASANLPADGEMVSKKKPLNYIKLRKKTNKNSRFKSFSVFLFILFVIVIAALIGLQLAGLLQDLDFSLIYENKIYFAVPLGVSVLGLIILLPILGHNNKKAFKASINLEYIDSASKEEALTKEQKAKLDKLLQSKDKFEKAIKRSSRVVTALISCLIAVLVAYVALFGIVALDNYGFIDNIKNQIEFIKDVDFIGKINTNTQYIAVGAAAGAGLVYGLIKKYKGILSALLIILLAIVAVLCVFIFL